MKTGIMLVGLCGVNSSTLVSGCTAMQLGLLPKQYGITETEVFDGFGLLDVDDLVFSGWDYASRDQFELFKRYSIVKAAYDQAFVDRLRQIVPYPGIRSALDIRPEPDFNNIAASHDLSDCISAIESNICDFKECNALTNVIVIYLGSPGRRVDCAIKHVSYEAFLRLPLGQIPSSLCYAVAALRSNAHFVDFTPSETLDFDFLHELAAAQGVQLSGRDGSTGQTMLKLTVGNMLKIRNLKLRGWYSTNILGNHDGYILSDPAYCQTKLEDKKLGLAALLGYEDFEHKVTIDYFQTRFDAKESWDSIDFLGWLGTPMTLKLNWVGEDAILSAPILLDIIRLIELGSRFGSSGFQRQLGLFYKHPYFCEGQSLETMYINLLDFYRDLNP